MNTELYLASRLLRHKIHAHFGRLMACNNTIKRPSTELLFYTGVVLAPTGFGHIQACIPRNVSPDDVVVQEQEISLGNGRCGQDMGRGWKEVLGSGCPSGSKILLKGAMFYLHI